MPGRLLCRPTARCAEHYTCFAAETPASYTTHFFLPKQTFVRCAETELMMVQWLCWKLSQLPLHPNPQQLPLTIRSVDPLYSKVQICQHLKWPLELLFSFVMISICSCSWLLNVGMTSRKRRVRGIACRRERGNSYTNLTRKSRGKISNEDIWNLVEQNWNACPLVLQAGNG